MSVSIPESILLKFLESTDSGMYTHLTRFDSDNNTLTLDGVVDLTPEEADWVEAHS